MSASRPCFMGVRCSDPVRCGGSRRTGPSFGQLLHDPALPQRRAEAVVRALVSRGVARELLVARGYGAQRPVSGNEDDAGRALNRRVAFTVEGL